MFNYRKNDILLLAKENSFIVNTTEKALRLCDFLTFADGQKERLPLILKGGTAINFSLLNLPRLSVDADFDFALNLAKEEMPKARKEIEGLIRAYMEGQGYELSQRSKFTHSLDSLVFSYQTLSYSRDVLKIEINYSNRCHILEPLVTKTSFSLCRSFPITRLSNEELIGSKISALLSRTTPRDLFDMCSLAKESKITNPSLTRKIALFYLLLSADRPFCFQETYDEAIRKIQRMDFNQMRKTLIPVLHLHHQLNIEEMKNYVINQLGSMFVLSDSEVAFVEQFNEQKFSQKLLFEDYSVNDLSNHPMVKWKLRG